MNYRQIGALLLTTTLATALCLAGGFNSGRVDDFEGGDTLGWTEGLSSPNPPVNMANGGPGGAGDNYLSDASSGLAGAGGRMVMFNLSWNGNWEAAQAMSIEADMANMGANALAMRIAIGSSMGNWYVSTSAMALPADGVWRSFSFDLDAMSAVGVSTETLAQVRADVTEFRILSVAGATPSRNGDQIAAVLGVDNIGVTTVPVELQTFSVD